jgi:hypothetical protein
VQTDAEGHSHTKRNSTGKTSTENKNKLLPSPFPTLLLLPERQRHAAPKDISLRAHDDGAVLRGLYLDPLRHRGQISLLQNGSSSRRKSSECDRNGLVSTPSQSGIAWRRTGD